ncbi:MAG: hypothetical protein ACTHJ0_07825 [Flavipsychrobacter sp.]
MKKFITATLFCMLAATSGYSQDRDIHHDDSPRFERIHAIKVAYITDKLHFTPEQSAQFWPLYNKYEQEMHGIRRSFFEKYKGEHNGDKATARQFIDDDLDYQQDILDLKRKYKDDFLKIISTEQLADLYRAERDFKLMLLKELNERHKRDGGDWRDHKGD